MVDIDIEPGGILGMAAKILERRSRRRRRGGRRRIRRGRNKNLFAKIGRDATVEDQSIELGRVTKNTVDEEPIPTFVVYSPTGICMCSNVVSHFISAVQLTDSIMSKNKITYVLMYVAICKTRTYWMKWLNWKIIIFKQSIKNQ